MQRMCLSLRKKNRVDVFRSKKKGRSWECIVFRKVYLEISYYQYYGAIRIMNRCFVWVRVCVFQFGLELVCAVVDVWARICLVSLCTCTFSCTFNLCIFMRDCVPVANSVCVCVCESRMSVIFKYYVCTGVKRLYCNKTIIDLRQNYSIVGLEIKPKFQVILFKWYFVLGVKYVGPFLLCVAVWFIWISSFYVCLFVCLFGE